jgi:hypothetical protein
VLRRRRAAAPWGSSAPREGDAGFGRAPRTRRVVLTLEQASLICVLSFMPVAVEVGPAVHPWLRTGVDGPGLPFVAVRPQSRPAGEAPYEEQL